MPAIIKRLCIPLFVIPEVCSGNLSWECWIFHSHGKKMPKRRQPSSAGGNVQKLIQPGGIERVWKSKGELSTQVVITSLTFVWGLLCFYKSSWMKVWGGETVVVLFFWEQVGLFRWKAYHTATSKIDTEHTGWLIEELSWSEVRLGRFLCLWLKQINSQRVRTLAKSE
jgi:hypothetical protein